MASPTLPWKKLWKDMWSMIPDPATDERIFVAVDDSINKKSGKNIFAFGNFHDHTAKGKQNRYPWAQCIVVIGRTAHESERSLGMFTFKKMK